MAALLRLVAATALLGSAYAAGSGADASGVPMIKGEAGLATAFAAAVANDETLFVRMFLNG